MLLIAALVICGMVVYVLRYIDHGQEWALYFSRANSGSTGQIYDRRGTQLAYFSGYENEFAPDEWTREANYHVTGDYWGRTGTGVLSSFWGEMQGFDLINGTTQTNNYETADKLLDFKMKKFRPQRGSSGKINEINFKIAELKEDLANLKSTYNSLPQLYNQKKETKEWRN